MQLETAETLEDLRPAVLMTRSFFGVDHVVYHWVNAAGDQFEAGTYSKAWVDAYRERNYVHLDPVVRACFQKFHPVDWKTLDWSGKATRAFLREAIEHGVGNQGFSVPIRGPVGQFALFTVSHNATDEAWAEFTEAHKRDLILIAHAFNQQALRLEPNAKNEIPQPLSPREVEAMTMLAMGLSRSQAAAQLEISEHTLRVYVESARHKLGAMNTTHAVARALSRGLIVV